MLYFRVKFWVSDPGRLTEEYTRYHVVLQLRRLLTDQVLPTPPTTAALLASYALQCEWECRVGCVVEGVELREVCGVGVIDMSRPRHIVKKNRAVNGL